MGDKQYGPVLYCEMARPIVEALQNLLTVVEKVNEDAEEERCPQCSEHARWMRRSIRHGLSVLEVSLPCPATAAAHHCGLHVKCPIVKGRGDFVDTEG